jgi:hypothetical protein
MESNGADPGERRVLPTFFSLATPELYHYWYVHVCPRLPIDGTQPL